MTEHAIGEWRCWGRSDGAYVIEEKEPDGEWLLICVTHHHKATDQALAKEHATRIVKTVNAHDKLVRACETALGDYRAGYIVGEVTNQKTVDRAGRIEMLRAALVDPEGVSQCRK